MSESLRDALEKLADDFAGKPHGGAVAYTWATRMLRELLAAHPVEPAGVSGAAVEAGVDVVIRFGSSDPTESIKAYMRAALEAAAPFMGAAPLASRERVAEVLREFANGEPDDDNGWALFADSLDDFTSALLAAGVFREERQP